MFDFWKSKDQTEAPNFSAGRVEFPRDRYFITCAICGKDHDLKETCPVCKSWRDESSLDYRERHDLLKMLVRTLGYPPLVKEKPGGQTI